MFELLRHPIRTADDFITRVVSDALVLLVKAKDALDPAGVAYGDEDYEQARAILARADTTPNEEPA